MANCEILTLVHCINLLNMGSTIHHPLLNPVTVGPICIIVANQSRSLLTSLAYRLFRPYNDSDTNCND